MLDKDGELILPENHNIITVTDDEFKIKTNHNFVKMSSFFKSYKRSMFENEPAPTDIRQGGLGDCYLLAALQSLVERNPKIITSMIKDLRHGWVVVRLYSNGIQPRYYKVEKTQLEGDNDPVQFHRAAWVHMIEKAYVYYRISTHQSTSAYYDDVIRGGYTHEAIGVICGNTKTTQIAAKTGEVKSGDRISFEFLRDMISIELSGGTISEWKGRNEEKFLRMKQKVFGISDHVVDFIKILNASNSKINGWKINNKKSLKALFNDRFSNGEKVTHEDVTEFVMENLHYDMTDPLNNMTIASLFCYVKSNFSGRRGTGCYSFDEMSQFNEIKEALLKKRIITVASVKNPSSGFVGRHAYQVVAVKEDLQLTGVETQVCRFLMLRHPWGVHFPKYMQVKQSYKDIFGQAREATLLSSQKTDEASDLGLPAGLNVSPDVFPVELSDFVKNFTEIMATEYPGA